MSSVAVAKRLAAIDEDLDALLAEPIDGTAADRAAAAYQLERVARRLPAVWHRLISALAEIPTEELGEPSLAAALSTLLRISSKEATRRIKEAADLGARTALTGEPLSPMLSHTAAAQVSGQIGAEHVDIIRTFFKKLPGFIDHDTREHAEAQLAQLAAGLRPEELDKAAHRLALLLDQDGELTDADRARRAYLTIGKQQTDGMSELRGRLDPQARALWEAVAAKWAAPGMCNPDDDNPHLDDPPTPAAVRGDARCTGKRNHDAFTALCRAILASGQLGSHHGLPVTMVISTTLAELESGRGHAVTGGGSLLPMSEVIRQAATAHHYLAIFDDHTQQALYLGRAKRFASKAQRLVLYNRDRGCTFPGCTAPAYHSEVHHRDRDWAAGGLTNINDETLACGKDNRRVKPGGWTTRTRKDGRTEWIPPPALDTGQTRINNYHHPERYLIPDEHDNDEGGDDDDGHSR
jgi:Domain of unknown function (DUF222)